MNKYWFKKRTFGWGWTPISWEGWTMTALLAFIIFYFISIYKALNLTENLGLRQIIFITILVVMFGFIADKKTKDKVLFK